MAVSRYEALLQHALSLPQATRDEPWEGDTVAKVAGKKIFVFFGSPGTKKMSVKLPESGAAALGLDGAAPTGYGLGRHGWVTVPIVGKGAPSVGVLRDWIDESYRAVAPKKLAAQLEEP